MQEETESVFTTGLSGLDTVLQGLRAGDNLVWHVEDIEEYRRFVLPYVRAAVERGRPVMYFRFAEHAELIAEGDVVEVRRPGSKGDFEVFVSSIVDSIEESSPETCYVFDCLSELAERWYSDRMMANFFLVVCPFVLKLGALAYFALYKHRHTHRATDEISQTAQLTIETYTHGGRTYIQPHRVDARHSSTIHMLHVQEDSRFLPVRNSALIADVGGSVRWPLLHTSMDILGIGPGKYREVTAQLRDAERGELGEKEEWLLRERLLRMLITHQNSFMPLAREYFDVPFLSDVLKRIIGSGLIGGKARGILLARRILERYEPSLLAGLEIPDSFYIGSDVFYTYIIKNDCWWLRRKKGSMDEILEQAALARERILNGKFLDYITAQFTEMLEYYGQSPIIVRSSSLQEDSYGNAFSGKYDSVFCASQGTLEERLEEFLSAVRTVYASSLSEEALYYRLHHGLLYEDEQMALLVQRVSGDAFGTHFYPPAAGVGFSYNPFVWDEKIDPHAGMLRLAFGLGTRAVDRIDNDYTRIVALNEPFRLPEKDPDDSVRYSQHSADILDLAENRFLTVPLSHAYEDLPPGILALFTDIDAEAAAYARERNMDEAGARRLTFNRFFRETDFCLRMRTILRTLETAYGCPVDIEFTVNITSTGEHRINLVQCRPFGVKILGAADIGVIPGSIPENRLFLRSNGPIVGRSVVAPIDRIVYVSPSAYTQLREHERYEVARLIGRLTRLPSEKRDPIVLLVGPGRWGTSTPAMGVPVSFREIRTVSIIVELAVMHEGLVPDVSLGTHFFNDLVEMDMLYFAVFPTRGDGCFREEFFEEAKKTLTIVEPDDPLWRRTITVLEGKKSDTDTGLRLHADASAQKALCYLA